MSAFDSIVARVLLLIGDALKLLSIRAYKDAARELRKAADQLDEVT